MESRAALKASEEDQEGLRRTGIDATGDLPWGTHFAHLYEEKEGLFAVLVPFFKAGLESNEFCVWVTADATGVEDVKKAMRLAMPDFEYHLSKGQIEIIPHAEWYTKGVSFDAQTVLEGWVSKYIQGLAKGCQGLRASGNASWLNKEEWDAFIRYEREVDNVIGSYRMLALCSYPLDSCGAEELLDVVSTHRFALIKRRGRLEVIERSEKKLAEEVLLRANRVLEKKVDERTSGLLARIDRLNEDVAVKTRLAETIEKLALNASDGLDRIMAAFPTLTELADKSEDERLKTSAEDIRAASESVARSLRQLCLLVPGRPA
ncbi:MAG: MEDS domain-containing protein [Deltaproteobacteria bacterium]|nr:MEDS domain-containing protein [Deltaproteobacteria bacterium]